MHLNFKAIPATQREEKETDEDGGHSGQLFFLQRLKTLTAVCSQINATS
jgi:hypothetical protein